MLRLFVLLMNKQVKQRTEMRFLSGIIQVHRTLRIFRPFSTPLSCADSKRRNKIRHLYFYPHACMLGWRCSLSTHTRREKATRVE